MGLIVFDYEIIKTKPNELIKDLKKHKNNEDYYYSLRKLDREPTKYKRMSKIKKASRFIFLNKTGYNGLYRVNQKGQNNVPYGRYSNPTIFEEDNILECSKYLQSATITTGDFENIKEHIKEGDFALMDFEGFIDGDAFQGGSAKAYTLEIGSGNFIPGFEDQMVGMKPDEEKEITVTFPEEYQSKDLAGKESVFKVTLLEIQEKVIPTDLDEETLKKFLPEEEAPTKELLETKVKEQITAEKLAKLYQEETKPSFVEALVKKYNIDLPLNIVEQEIDMAFRNAFNAFNEEDVKKYSTDADAAKEKREEYRADASDSVKLTFIVDELAKQEEIAVDDQEVMQTIYYEALQSGQDPQAYIKQYEEKGLLPAVKMAIVEDKLFKKLFDEK